MPAKYLTLSCIQATELPRGVGIVRVELQQFGVGGYGLGLPIQEFALRGQPAPGVGIGRIALDRLAEIVDCLTRLALCHSDQGEARVWPWVLRIKPGGRGKG